MKSLTRMKKDSEATRAIEILKKLKKEYPVASIALEFQFQEEQNFPMIFQKVIQEHLLLFYRNLKIQIKHR